MKRHQRGEVSHFLVRRNPNYPRRRQLLPSINEKHATSATNSIQSLNSLTTTTTIVTPSDISKCKEETCKLCPCASNGNGTIVDITGKELIDLKKNDVCLKCKNNFKSCDFCNKTVNGNKMITEKFQSPPSQPTPPSANQTTTYNPVYNIREIRSVCHSFSAFGIDKKLMEVERNNNSNNHNHISKMNNRHSFCSTNINQNSSNGGGYTKPDELSQNSTKGLGNFIYI